MSPDRSPKKQTVASTLSISPNVGPFLPMLTKKIVSPAALASFLTFASANFIFAAEPAPSAPTVTAPAAPAPAPGAPNPGRGRGGPPATPEELAQIAKLKELPLLTRSAGQGDFKITPPYDPAPEETPRPDVAKGRIERFTLVAAESKFYPGTGMRGATPTREVVVYIPARYVAGTPLPFIVTADAYGVRNDQQLPVILDNMIADRRLPAMAAIMVNNGGGDARGSERGLEYDTVSGKYAEFIEAEVLPRVEKEFGVTLTKDPQARATMGGSSGAAAAFTMAWFHPEWYRRVLSYSGTFVNAQPDAHAPHGAWEYHENLIPKNPAKPLRIWLHVSEGDNGATASGAGMRNWVLANQRMAAELKAKGYAYQFVYSETSGHTDRRVIRQTMAHALEWLWQDYKPANAPR